MTTTIRPATRADSDGLATLCMEIHALHVEMFPHFFRVPTRKEMAKTFRDRLAGPDLRAFLAFVKGRPVGYVLIRVIRRTETTMTQAIAFVEIDHIHVRKAYRRRGIGRALAAQALDVARDVGVETVQLNVWARNRTAVAAFRSLGFRPQRYVMKLEQPRKLERHRRPSGVKHVRRGSPPDP